MHAQVTVQPWGFQADTQIAPLIQRLWDRDMKTEFSCQGNPRNPAYIMFEYVEHAIEFALQSSEALGDYSFDISLFSGDTGTRGRVTFPNKCIPNLQEIW